MRKKRSTPVIATQPGKGPRGPFPELSVTGEDVPQDPPEDGEESDESGKFEPEAGDNSLVVRLGDCRKCQHNLSANADLILVNALKYSYAALADNINSNTTVEAQVSRSIPINGAQLVTLLLRLQALGAPPSPINTGPLGGLVWFPQDVNFFTNPNPDPDPAEIWKGRASPAEIGAYFMTATAHAYKLWQRSKVNQKQCCKKHVLNQSPIRKRVTVWLGSTKKKITV